MAPDQKEIGGVLEYLPEGEEVIGSHRIGGYDIVTTSERINCIRRFPQAFIEINYLDISSLQHITRIRWNELLKALAFLTVALAAYFNDMGRPYIETIQRIIHASNPELANVLPVDFLLSALIVFCAVAGIWSLSQFIPSLRGYFRISRKSGAPVIIPTSMSLDLKALIREIEAQIHAKNVAAKMPFAPEADDSFGDPVKAAQNIRKKLDEGLENISDKKVIIVEAKSENHKPTLASLMDILISKNGMGGVYISVSKPSDSILAAIEEGQVSTEDVFFIDCISLMAGKIQKEKSEKVVFVENPSSLEEISMYLDKMLKRVESKNKFLFLDSLSSLLIYNTDKSVKEFTHYLINKIRLENLMGIILTIEKKEAEDLVRTLTPMCDVQFKF